MILAPEAATAHYCGNNASLIRTRRDTVTQNAVDGEVSIFDVAKCRDSSWNAFRARTKNTA